MESTGGSLQRCGAACLDVTTGLACVAFWAGTWSLFDCFAIQELASGAMASCIVVFISLANAHQWLDTMFAEITPVLADFVAWLWTSVLVVQSILIWRMGFNVVETYLLPAHDSFRAIVLAVLGFFMLGLGGRLRSCGSAPPVGFASDQSGIGSRFPAASFGRGFVALVLDFALTIPVIIVWAGLWQFGDNLVVPLWPSFVVCNIVIAALGVFRVDAFLRSGFSGSNPTIVTACADAIYTLMLALLCVGSWRATWELLDRHLLLVSHPRIAALTMVFGVALLTALRRYRSALFEPMDFTLDREGPYFFQTGVHTYLAKGQPGEDAEAPFSAPSPGYNSTRQ